MLCLGQRAVRTAVSDPAETRYGGAVDVKRATDLYAEGWTLRQIGAELDVHWAKVSEQLRRAGVTISREPVTLRLREGLLQPVMMGTG